MAATALSMARDASNDRGDAWQYEEETLRRYALDAWGHYPEPTDKKLRVDYIRSQLRSPALRLGERTKGGVSIFAEWITLLLNEYSSEAESQRSQRDVISVPLKSGRNSHEPEANPKRADDNRFNETSPSQAARKAPRGPISVEMLSREKAEANASTAARLQASALYTIKLFGQPIANYTVGKARECLPALRNGIDQEFRNYRCIERLISHLDGNINIGEHWAPLLDVVDGFYEQSSKEAAALCRQAGLTK